MVSMTRSLSVVALALAVVACSSSTTTTPPTTSTPTTTVSPGTSTTLTTIAATPPTPSSTSTTTTSTTTSTTTTSTTSTTTTTIANAAPEVQITGPTANSLHRAEFDADAGWFVAQVTMSATASDPDGDAVTIAWSASPGGSLGTGATITAGLQPTSDSTRITLTARATDARGASAAASIDVVVWIPSA
jgi:hypothetical protein